jgi:putative DNA primase/helicase
MPESFRSAAENLAREQIASLEFEIAALIKSNDAPGTLAAPFVQKCALLEESALFDAGAKLRAIHGFSLREWRRRVKVEQEALVTAAPKPKPNGQAPTPGAPDLINGFEPEDVGNGQRLIKMHGEKLRYCADLRDWLIWTGTHWATDQTETVRKLTQQTLLEFGIQAITHGSDSLAKFAVQSRKSTRVSNAMLEARPHLAVIPSQLDRHPYHLNFLNGTVDLRTGELSPHDPSQFITKLVHYNYNPKADCPVFKNFLAEITAKPDASEADEESALRSASLGRYLQTAFGYSLTAITREKCVFLLYGEGGNNGKSTLLSTFRDLVRDYSVLLRIETLMQSKFESSNDSADIADLRSARYVMSSETQENQHLSEAKVKRICQGLGDIKAARKWENHITFQETHKLWIDANHLPVVRSQDGAIWDRLKTIPFDVRIPKERQDPNLKDKLLGEAEGILGWAVRGAQRWFKEGLKHPPEVNAAVASWKKQSDHLSRFIEEKCELNPDRFHAASLLYAAYKYWTEAERVPCENGIQFASRLLSMPGISREHTFAGWVYRGIRLTEATPSKDDDVGPHWSGDA